MNKIRAILNRAKENFKKNKVSTILILCIWILVIVVTLFSYGNSLGKKSFGSDYSDKYVELNKNTIVIESVKLENDIDSIALKFATYARKNKGNVQVIVKGNRNNYVYLDETISCRSIEDNAYRNIKLKESINISEEPNITITIKSNSEKDKGVALYYSSEKLLENSRFYINNLEINGDASVRFLYYDSELNTFSNIVLISTLIGITLILLLLLLIDPRYEILFTTIAIVLGLAFCFIMTPMSIPDEQTHYEFSFQLSNYIMGEDNHLLFDSEYQNYGAYAGHLNVSSAYSKIMQKFNSRLELDNKKVEMLNDIDEVYKICYFPQAIGITIARILKLNRIKTFYLGRLFNLSFYILCVYFAIKKTPMHKLVFGVIATLPMFLHQAASYSYDCFVNGLCLLTISYLLKFIYVDERIKTKELIFITIVCSILSPAKVVYSFFSLLFFLVPAQRYGNNKKKIICTLLINISGIYQLFSIIYPVVLKAIENIKELSNNNPSYNLISNNNTYIPKEERFTIGYMVRNPLEIISLLYRTIRYNIKIWFYGTFGRALSGVSLILPLRLVHIMVIITTICAFAKEQYHESVVVKVIFIVTCIIIGLFTLGGLLLTWTSTTQEIVSDFGGTIIEGIQGRYFCPLLPYSYTIFNNKKINFERKFNKYLISSHLMVVFVVIIYVLSYTFVN